MSRDSDPYQSAENSSSTAPGKLVIDEERKILSRQYEMMQHIDDRALRITRTSAVLLGITYTGLSLLVRPSSESTNLVAPNISGFTKLFGGVGVLGITLALIIGIVTTQYSQPIYGIGKRVRHGISARGSKHKAVSELSESYDRAIDLNQSRLERNRRLLWGVQIMFIFGLIFLLLASSLALNEAVQVGASTNSTEAGIMSTTVTSIRKATQLENGEK